MADDIVNVELIEETIVVEPVVTVTGPAGDKGTDGNDGLGVPAGGAAGQFLSKKTATDNDTEWTKTLAGADEAITTVAVVDAQDITVNYDANGLVLDIDETVVSFSLTQGVGWSDTTLASMLIYIREVGTLGSAPAIIFNAGWGFHAAHTPALADGRTADTGYAQLELYRIAGDQFCKLVEET